MSLKLADYIARLRRVADYRPEQHMPERLVTPSSSAHWIGEEVTHNPGRIGLMLDIPAATLEFFLQELPPGGTSDLQRHTHESVHYVLEGSGYSEIGSRTEPWGAGDFIYTPVWVWHRHYNTSPGTVRMLLVENSRLTEAMGVARRETAGLIPYADLAGFAGGSGAQRP